jgi:hypothetical protein
MKVIVAVGYLYHIDKLEGNVHPVSVIDAVVGKVTVIKLLRYITSYFLSNW